MTAARFGIDDRGIALPMALFALVLLMSLTLAFIGLSRWEPTIATNLMHSKQARALAESGLEYAIWGISNPTSSGILANSPPQGSVAASPFDGSQFERVSLRGGFTVSVLITDEPTPNVVNAMTVTSVGQTTTDSTSTTATAKSQITAQYTYFSDMGINTPCALCVRGDLNLTGSTNMTGAPNGGACGTKYGAWSTDDVELSGNAQINGKSEHGKGGGPVEGTDYLEEQPDSAFTAFALSASQLAALKAKAKSSGTYLSASAANGTVTLSNVPDGLVFVDSYTDATSSACSPVCLPNSSDTVTASIGPGAFKDTSGFQGWLIVNGNMTVHGNFGGANGLVFVTGDLSDGGMGNSGFTGVVMVQRANGTSDPSTAGNANVTFDCTAVDNNQPMNPGWALVPGTYNDTGN